MEIISPGWFIWHALVGIAIGYALRLFEHAVWRSMQHEPTGSMFGFAMLIIPPLLVVGATLGYISVVLLAPAIKDGTAISFSAYLLTAFWAFLSLDVRDFLRRCS
jgi:hypothetical protein